MLLVLVAVAGAGAGAGATTTYDLAVDVPTHLGGVDRLPNAVVHRVAASYSVSVTLDSSIAIGAISRRPSGLWLFAPRHAASIGGVHYEPRDVVSFDGTSYVEVLDGGAAGVPAGARIDAIFETGGAMVLSFDVPVTLGGTDYSRSDLVAYGGTFVPYWDAEAAGVEPGANVCGADLDAAGSLVLAFDAPALLSGAFHLPGELVSWSGTAFSTYAVDPAWPAASVLRDFSFLPAAGSVLNTGVPLTAAKEANGDITLEWRGSCLPLDADYEVYEGSIGSWYSHASKLCTTGGATEATLAPAAGSSYYLVVPRNAVAEGSYSKDSNGIERPQGASACLEQSIADCQ
jgi:hypothetical protein